MNGSVSPPEFGWRPGLRVGVGLGLAVFPVAVSFGALATTLGWPPLPTIVCSVIVFSAGAQLALLTTLTAGSGLFLALGAATLINLRFLPMGITVASSLEGPIWKRALGAQTILDGSWAAAYQGAGRYDRLTMFGASAVQWPAWILGTVVGVVAAPQTSLVESLGLDLVFPGFFLILLLDSFRSTPRGPWIAGIAILLTGGLVLVAPVGVAVLLSALSALVVLIGHGRRGSEPTDDLEPE
ncbi:MAG: AzlC family ABC transporter permease [Geodermatophilaceae bacterium]|nr:AzlC family ABC transporter permease [Geodermatophilaceae bacterium]